MSIRKEDKLKFKMFALFGHGVHEVAFTPRRARWREEMKCRNISGFTRRGVDDEWRSAVIKSYWTPIAVAVLNPGERIEGRYPRINQVTWYITDDRDLSKTTKQHIESIKWELAGPAKFRYVNALPYELTGGSRYRAREIAKIALDSALKYVNECKKLERKTRRGVENRLLAFDRVMQTVDETFHMLETHCGCDVSEYRARAEEGRNFLLTCMGPHLVKMQAELEDAMSRNDSAKTRSIAYHMASLLGISDHPEYRLWWEMIGD